MSAGIFANLITALGVALIFSIIPITELLLALKLRLVLGSLIIFPTLLSDNLFCP
jgi:hypothetical protein